MPVSDQAIALLWDGFVVIAAADDVMESLLRRFRFAAYRDIGTCGRAAADLAADCLSIAAAPW